MLVKEKKSIGKVSLGNISYSHPILKIHNVLYKYLRETKYVRGKKTFILDFSSFPKCICSQIFFQNILQLLMSSGKEQTLQYTALASSPVLSPCWIFKVSCS